MKHRNIVIATIFFAVIYGLASTIGSIFLVTWGGTNWFKEIMVFMYSFPVDWSRLVVQSGLFYMLLNVVFWSSIFYLVCWLARKLGTQAFGQRV